MVATEAYRVITEQTESLMRLILSVSFGGNHFDYLGALALGQLLGIYRAWCISGAALVGCGDELYLADLKRLERLSQGKV